VRSSRAPVPVASTAPVPPVGASSAEGVNGSGTETSAHADPPSWLRRRLVAGPAHTAQSTLREDAVTVTARALVHGALLATKWLPRSVDSHRRELLDDDATTEIHTAAPATVMLAAGSTDANGRRSDLQCRDPTAERCNQRSWHVPPSQRPVST